MVTRNGMTVHSTNPINGRDSTNRRTHRPRRDTPAVLEPRTVGPASSRAVVPTIRVQPRNAVKPGCRKE